MRTFTRLFPCTGILLALLGAGHVVAEPVGLSEAALNSKMQQSEWVSLLQVQSVNSLVNVSQVVSPGAYAVHGYRYSAEVLREWKGELADTIKFQVDLSGCQTLLSRDQHYLVFGTTDLQGVYLVEDCASLIPHEQAKHLLSALDGFDHRNDHSDNLKNNHKNAQSNEQNDWLVLNQPQP